MQQTITPLDSARDAAGSAARRFVELLYRSEAPSFPGLGAPGHVRIMSGLCQGMPTGISTKSQKSRSGRFTRKTEPE